MRLVLTLSLLTAACDRNPPAPPVAQLAPTAPIAQLAAWEPIDKSFTGCEGG